MHRPAVRRTFHSIALQDIFQPGCINTTEVDLRKLSHANKPTASGLLSSDINADGSGIAQSHHQRPGLRRCTLIRDILRQEVCVKMLLKHFKSLIDHFSSHATWSKCITDIESCREHDPALSTTLHLRPVPLPDETRQSMDLGHSRLLEQR